MIEHQNKQTEITTSRDFFNRSSCVGQNIHENVTSFTIFRNLVECRRCGFSGHYTHANTTQGLQNPLNRAVYIFQIFFESNLKKISNIFLRSN